MPRIGLALSGGGFRATLYHLGVVRFLRDVGLLKNVTDIASVSGGSILAAHLALNWDSYNGDDQNFDDVTREIVKFVRFDLRNHILRRIPLQIPLRLLAKLHLVDHRKFTPNAVLENYYKKYLYGDRCLYELPEQPRLHILATNVSTGALSAFNRRGLFIQQRDDDGIRLFKHIPGQMASIPRVVGASSAFPGFFPPVELNAADLGVHEGEFPTEFFTDGGVYDNLGLRAFSWIKAQKTEFDQVLVSDAGKPFQILTHAALGPMGQSVRATDILWDRVWQLERENFGTEEGFLFLPITEFVDLSEDPTALQPVVQTETQTIRTDLDRFSTDEINALSQHGYEVARKICRLRGVLGDSQPPESPPWAPLPIRASTKDEPISEPPQEPAEATKLSRRLRRSSHRRILTTFFDWRDWPSYVYVAIALVVFLYLPLQVYKLYLRSQEQSIIIDAIASGDPDIREILKLATSDPTAHWVSEKVQDKSEPTKMNFDGIEVLSHTRIYDLRRWHPDEASANRRGLVYERDRITLRLLNSYRGDGHIVFTRAVDTRAKNIQFRQPSKKSPRGIISRITQPVDEHGQQRVIYQFEYDLSKLAREQAVTIDLETILEFPKTVRAPFRTQTKTDLISLWMLFPPDRPYKNYSLVTYPEDRSVRPTIMGNRYVIDHPYGTIIGWSVVNPKHGYVYETRWSTE